MWVNPHNSIRAILVVAGTVFLSGCGEEAPVQQDLVRPVKAVEVSDPQRLQDLWLPGQAKAVREATLAFRVSGQIQNFDVVVGARPSAGDVLAQLDPQPYQSEVDAIAADLESARATALNAKQQYDRDFSLFQDGHVSQARVDTRTAELNQARGSVAALEARLERAELNLSYTFLRAPFDGRVVATYVENFEEVQAQQSVLRMVDPSQVEMVVDVPESLISVAPQVQEVIVEFDAFPDVQIPGRISEIGTEASETTRTYPVTIVMEQPDGMEILPGMAGRATAVEPPAGLEPPQISIPVGAVFTDESGATSFVWVIDRESNTVSRRKVTTGELSNSGIFITEGLEPGMWVVTAGVTKLKDGQTVRLLEDKPEGTQ